MVEIIQGTIFRGAIFLLLGGSCPGESILGGIVLSPVHHCLKATEELAMSPGIFHVHLVSVPTLVSYKYVFMQRLQHNDHNDHIPEMTTKPLQYL